MLDASHPATLLEPSRLMIRFYDAAVSSGIVDLNTRQRTAPADEHAPGH
ncbi:MAG TPA: hypothetical protein VGH81_10785 [Rudaea sp.]|jgi:hypothetical protein